MRGRREWGHWYKAVGESANLSFIYNAIAYAIYTCHLFNSIMMTESFFTRVCWLHLHISSYLYLDLDLSDLSDIRPYLFTLHTPLMYKNASLHDP